VSAFIDEHRERFGVEPVCQTLGVSASVYYSRAIGERSERAVEDERVLAVIKTTHAANYFAYGYRRMWKALERAGGHVPRCQVQRLMVEHGLQGAKRRGKPWRTTRPDPQALRSPDPGRSGLHGRAAERVVGVRFHVLAVLGGRLVLQLRDRCVQPDGDRLAARCEHAHHARARRAADGARGS
jgi:putative transposase